MKSLKREVEQIKKRPFSVTTDKKPATVKVGHLLQKAPTRKATELIGRAENILEFQRSQLLTAKALIQRHCWQYN